MCKFQIGDAVKLNSGSPVLRVVGVEKDITVEFVNDANETEQFTMPAPCFNKV